MNFLIDQKKYFLIFELFISYNFVISQISQKCSDLILIINFSQNFKISQILILFKFLKFKKYLKFSKNLDSLNFGFKIGVFCGL